MNEVSERYKEQNEQEHQIKQLERDFKREDDKNKKPANKIVIKTIIKVAIRILAPYIAILLVLITLFSAVTVVFKLFGDNNVSSSAVNTAIKAEVTVEAKSKSDGSGEEYYFKIDKNIVDKYIQELQKAYDRGEYEVSLNYGDDEDDLETDIPDSIVQEPTSAEPTSIEPTDVEPTTEELLEESEEKVEYNEATVASWFQTEDRAVWEPYLIKMIKADIASSYPKLGNYEGQDSDNEHDVRLGNKKDEDGNYVAQGIAEIKRTKMNDDGTAGEEILLEYLPHDRLEELISAGNEEALNYYYFEPASGLIYYATEIRTEEDGAVSRALQQNSASYRSLIAMCSMPYNFTFSLLQVSENPEWVMKVIDLLLTDSKVVLMVQDQLSTTTIREVKARAVKINEQNYEGKEIEKLKVIYKRVGEDPVIKEIYNEYRDKYELVSGDYYDSDYKDDYKIIYNEENADRSSSLEDNIKIDRVMYKGDIFIVGYDSEEEKLKTLEDDDIDEILEDLEFSDISRDVEEKSGPDVKRFWEEDGDEEIIYAFPERKTEFEDEEITKEQNQEDEESKIVVAEEVIKRNFTTTSNVFIQEADTWCIKFKQIANENPSEDVTEKVIYNYSEEELQALRYDNNLKNPVEELEDEDAREGEVTSVIKRYLSINDSEAMLVPEEVPTLTPSISTDTDQTQEQSETLTPTPADIVPGAHDRGDTGAITYKIETTTSNTGYTISQDGDGKVINYKKFLGLLENATGIYSAGAEFDEENRGRKVGYNLPEPKDNVIKYPADTITASSQERIDTLLQLLAMHEDTQMHEQLMMYYWNIYMDSEKYKVDKDDIFDLFNTAVNITPIGTAVSIGGGVDGGFSGSVNNRNIIQLIQSQLAYWEGTGDLGSGGVRKNASGEDCYVAYWDKWGKTLTIGHGVTWKYDKEYFIARGVTSLSEGTLVPKTIVDEIELELIKRNYKKISDLYSNVQPKLKDYQIAALTIGYYNNERMVYQLKTKIKSRYVERIR